MYVTYVKTLGIEALKTVFDAQYPIAEFRGQHCSLEYPVEATSFPEIWLRYTDTGSLRQSGVAHVEDADPVNGARVAPYTRWRFEGTFEFVVVALSSLERDRLYDELVATVAWSQTDSLRGRFRRYVEDNEFVACNVKWDEIESTGEDASPGTPWGTDEIVYERTLNLDLFGEFVPDPVTGTLIPLSKVLVTPTADTSLDDAARGEGFDVWH